MIKRKSKISLVPLCPVCKKEITVSRRVYCCYAHKKKAQRNRKAAKRVQMNAQKHP